MTTALAQPPIPDLLSPEEARALITQINTHYHTGRALLAELDARGGAQALNYRNMEALVEAEFGWSAAHYYRQVQAAGVERNLSLQIGEMTESHARELAPLPPDVQRQVWELVKNEPHLTAKRIRLVAAEVRPPSPTLPNGGEPEPAPSPRPAQVITAFPSVVGLSCDWCGKRFEQKLEPGERAERVCPRCRVKGPTPPPEGDGGQEATSPHAEDDQGARRLEPAPPREGDLAAPPTHGIPASVPVVTVTPSPGAGLAHGGAEGVGRQGGGLGAYFSAPPPTHLPEVREPDVAEGRTVSEIATRAREDAEILRVVREVSAGVDGGLPRLLRVLSQPGFLNWMNRHRGKQGG